MSTIDSNPDPDIYSDRETFVTVGGNELVVGGWADYELDRLREERNNETADPFAGRTFITVNDLVQKMGGMGSTLAVPVAVAYENLRRKADEYTGKFVGGDQSVLLIPPEVRTPRSMEDVYETVHEFEKFVSATRKTSRGAGGKREGGNIFDTIPVIPPRSPVFVGGNEPPEKLARIEHEARNHLYEVEKFYLSTAERIENFTGIIGELINDAEE